MSSQAIKINAKLVDIGMYVCKLDRPWENTPFLIHGFYVRERDEVKQLKVHCDYLYIDPSKGSVPENLSSEAKKPAVYRGKLVPIKVNAGVYSAVEPIAKEMAVAQKIYAELLAEIDLVMAKASSGSTTEVKGLVDINNAVVDSFIRNPDAFIWLVRVRKTDDNPYYYLVRCACWALLFGRHLGLAKVDLKALSISLLLKDIGKLQLPKAIQSKLFQHQENNTADVELQTLVTENTVNALRQFSYIHPKVIKIIKMHHERLNGSGFPEQLSGDQIFILSKIASIASYYDSVTYKKGAKCAISVSKSVSHLYRVRGIEFQEDLVVEFIKAIGLYPTGTLIKLTNNEIAVVVEQNYDRRLKPKVLIVVDQQGRALNNVQLFDLFESDKRHQTSLDAGKKGTQKIDIVEDIEPYKYPIKVSKIRADYIAMHAKKSFFSMFKK